MGEVVVPDRYPGVVRPVAVTIKPRVDVAGPLGGLDVGRADAVGFDLVPVDRFVVGVLPSRHVDSEDSAAHGMEGPGAWGTVVGGVPEEGTDSPRPPEIAATVTPDRIVGIGWFIAVSTITPRMPMTPTKKASTCGRVRMVIRLLPPDRACLVRLRRARWPGRSGHRLARRSPRGDAAGVSG